MPVEAREALKLATLDLVANVSFSISFSGPPPLLHHDPVMTFS